MARQQSMARAARPGSGGRPRYRTLERPRTVATVYRADDRLDPSQAALPGDDFAQSADAVARSIALAMKSALLDGFVQLRPQGRRFGVQRIAAPACRPWARHALV